MDARLEKISWMTSGSWGKRLVSEKAIEKADKVLSQISNTVTMVIKPNRYTRGLCLANQMYIDEFGKTNDKIVVIHEKGSSYETQEVY